MDEATSRSQSSGRRMASAKGTTSTRKSSSGRKSASRDDATISPARWAGVALVVAALVGAIALAVISPSDPGTTAPAPAAAVDVATPSPEPTTADTRVPAARPRIVNPVEGITGELDISVQVSIPEEELGRRKLTLVILRNGEEIAEKSRPKTDGKDVVPSVRLLEGVNELSAALEGPGGLGPLSEPVLVTVDRDVPPLALTSPRSKSKSKTFDDVIVVEGTSEPGAEVKIANAKSKYENSFVVGPDGEFEHSVPLQKGQNRIVVESRDQAGMKREDHVVVARKDGKPVIELILPEKLKRSDLPREIKVKVVVTDTDKEPMPDAVVSYHVGGTGRIAETHEDVTNASGRSTWTVEVGGANGAEDVIIGVEVTSPYGQTRSHNKVIPID